MDELATLDQFKRRLKMDVSETAEDEDLSALLEEAQAAVLSYLAKPEDEDWTATIAAWTADDVPREIRAAILTQAVELYRFRGDDAQGPPRDEGAPFSRQVQNLLVRWRPLVVA